MVSALLVRRNSSAAIGLPSISSVNFRLSGSPSARPQMRQPVAGRRHFRIGVAADVEEILRPDVDRVGAEVAAMIEIDRRRTDPPRSGRR